MGLDLYIRKAECPTCGHSSEEENFACTYNVSKMWYKMYPDDKQMVPIDGLTGTESLPKLKEALDILVASPKNFVSLNPPNGFGSYEGFKNFIRKLIIASEENPDGVWYSWR